MFSADVNDLYNLNDSINLFMRRCNYVDSTQTTILNNLVIDLIEFTPAYDYIYPVSYFLRIVDTATIVNDLVDFSFSG